MTIATCVMDKSVRKYPGYPVKSKFQKNISNLFILRSYLLFVWKSNLTPRPMYLMAKSGDRKYKGVQDAVRAYLQ